MPARIQYWHILVQWHWCDCLTSSILRRINKVLLQGKKKLKMVNNASKSKRRKISQTEKTQVPLEMLVVTAVQDSDRGFVEDRTD